jgi:hypothetical protein
MKRILVFVAILVAFAISADARGSRERGNRHGHREYRGYRGYHGYYNYHGYYGIQDSVEAVVGSLREIQSDLDDRSYRSRRIRTEVADVPEPEYRQRGAVQMAQEEEQLPVGVFFQGEWLCNNTTSPVVLLVDKRAVSILRPGRKTSVAAYAGHEITFRKGER